MHTRATRGRELVRGREGVALPLALMGLVVVSLMVTAMLLSGSTEVALSTAHQDATRGLYSVEGGLEAFVAEHPSAFVPTAGDEAYAYTPTGGRRVDISVRNVATLSPESGPVERLFAIAAMPVAGNGRSVSAMVRVVSGISEAFDFNATSAIVVGSKTTITGSSEIHRSSPRCADVREGDKAVLRSRDVEINYKDKNVDPREIEVFDGDRNELAKWVLGEATVASLALRAEKQMKVRDFRGTPNTSVVKSDLHNWGCPRDLGVSCGVHGDTAYYPSVVIDGSGSNGRKGTVHIQGGHGQGILIILNADLKANNLVYKGLIIVEGNYEPGGGNTALDGSIYAMGETVLDESKFNANAEWRFNRCALNRALDQFNDPEKNPNNSSDPVISRTFAWSEVVR